MRHSNTQDCQTKELVTNLSACFQFEAMADLVQALGVMLCEAFRHATACPQSYCPGMSMA